MPFDKVEAAVKDAKGIAWDRCHKIYVLMDDQQMREMRGYGYHPLIASDEATPDEMLTLLHEWWDASCGLRFIQSIKSVPGDPNDGYTNLIEQFEEDEDYLVEAFARSFPDNEDENE